jgi:hypothetical protein
VVADQDRLSERDCLGHRAGLLVGLAALLRGLLGAGLVEETATEPSERGPSRTILAATAEGRRLVGAWLDQPVDHVRDVRSLLLLKLALLDRSGADRGPLLEEQRRRLEAQRRSLAEALASAEGFDRVILQWRLSGSAATIDFLDALDAIAR